jgi:hypothetical protein
MNLKRHECGLTTDFAMALVDGFINSILYQQNKYSPLKIISI